MMPTGNIWFEEIGAGRIRVLRVRVIATHLMRVARAKLNVPMLTRNQGHHVGRAVSLLSIMIAPHRIIVRSLPNGGGCNFDLRQGIRKRSADPAWMTVAGRASCAMRLVRPRCRDVSTMGSLRPAPNELPRSREANGDGNNEHCSEQCQPSGKGHHRHSGHQGSQGEPLADVAQQRAVRRIDHRQVSP